MKIHTTFKAAHRDDPETYMCRATKMITTISAIPIGTTVGGTNQAFIGRFLC